MSPYGTKISISEKCVSDNFFHSQNMFHNISYWLKPKNQQKIFRPHFSKIITSYCPPIWPKIQFPKNAFPATFSLTKHVSHYFILIKAKNWTKNFYTPFFKNNYKLLSPYWTKNSISEKIVSDNFFQSQNMFHNISYWLKPKNLQKSFRPNFSKIYTSYCPPIGPKIQFPKKLFPTTSFNHKICFTTFHID